MAQESAREAYVSVMGFLSEDAQAALFRYLPHLQECVDKDVAAFCEKLKDDLVRRASDESDALSKRLSELAKLATGAGELADESGNLPGDVSGAIGRVVEAAEDFERGVVETTTLLRRVEALGNRVAEIPQRRTLDGLRWAFEDLKDSHDRWCGVAPADQKTADRSLAEALEDMAGKFEALEEVLDLAQAAATAEDEATQEFGAEKATVGGDDPIGPVDSDDAERDSGGAAGPVDPIGTGECTDAPTGTPENVDRPRGKPDEERVMDDCVRDLAGSVWRLASDLQAAQARRVRELVGSVAELRQQATRLAKWDDAAARLRQAAEVAKVVVEDAKGAFNAAVEGDIKATHLDLLGGGDLVSGRPQKAKDWRFWRRT